MRSHIFGYMAGLLTACGLFLLAGAADTPQGTSASVTSSVPVLIGQVASPTTQGTDQVVPVPDDGRITPVPDDGKLRIICFGAHPDDNEFDAGGVAALWARQGHHVKFVACTNGDVGHNVIAGGPLAQRRTTEVERCADILGIQTEVLDIHDGELLPTLENRRTLTRLIREWQADIVMGHRPNDYHPDHRNVGLLVQDAAYHGHGSLLLPGHA